MRKGLAARAGRGPAGPAAAVVSHPARLRLRVRRLSRSVDDTARVRTRSGRLFGSDTGGGTVDVVTGPFRRGEIFAAVTPCDQNDAPATCPGPGVRAAGHDLRPGGPTIRAQRT